MRKNSILIALALMMVVIITISCEKDFDDIENLKNPIDTTNVTNPIDTNSIDTTPSITIVPKVFVPAKKLTIGNSFALVGFTNSPFKSATDGGHDNGNGKSNGHAYGLYKMKMKDGMPVMDSIYTTGENDSISVGNEIYVSEILDLNNGHVLLKGSFKFALDTLGNKKTKHDLIVKKSDGYIVNFDDNDEEYIIDKQFYNTDVRNMSNGDVLFSQFDGNYYYIQKLVIGESDVTTEDVTTDLSWYFNVDNNNNVIYYQSLTEELKILHASTGIIETVSDRYAPVNDTMFYWDFYTNELNEVFLITTSGFPNAHYYIYKMNITSDSYSLELVNDFEDINGFQYVSFQNNGGSNLVYNLSKGNVTTFITYDNNTSSIVWLNANNNTSEKRVLFSLTDDFTEKIITINSDDYVYMTLNSSVLKVSISSGDKTENYFYNSDYKIESISTSSDDYLTIATVRTSDNASVVWSVSPNGSAEIISETANIVTSVENIE
jgi:hypothetical protein